MRSTRDSLSDPRGGDSRHVTASLADPHFSGRPGDAGAALAEALAGVAHLPSHIAGIEARLGRIEEGMASLRRALPPLLVTLPEAARALGVSYATIRRMKKAGRLPLVGSGRSARVDLSALHAPDEDGIARDAAAACSRESPGAADGQEDGDGPT